MTKEELIKTLEKYDIEVNRLFQENKKLKDTNKKLVEDNCEFLQQRIDKAIEYIEEKWYEKNTMDIYSVVSTGDIRIDLLKILKGE